MADRYIMRSLEPGAYVVHSGDVRLPLGGGVTVLPFRGV